MILSDILKDSNYKLTQFEHNDRAKIKYLENNIILRESKSIITPYINCIVRKKEIKLTPEEVIRQLYVMVLQQDYGYSIERMELEY